MILVVFCIGCSTGKHEELPFYVDADFTPKWISARSEEYAMIHKVSPFSLTNQNGEIITDEDFEGKLYVADFFFTSCGRICPRVASNMKKVQEAVSDDSEVLLISHSVTPERDSVAVLREYAQKIGAKSGKWHLVTGTRKEIYKLARESYFADEDLGLAKSDDEFLHTENLILVDKDRRIRGIYKGTFPTEIDRLVEDIGILKREYP